MQQSAGLSGAGLDLRHARNLDNHGIPATGIFDPEVWIELRFSMGRAERR